MIVGSMFVFASSEMTHCIQHTGRLILFLPSLRRLSLTSSDEELSKGRSSLSSTRIMWSFQCVRSLDLLSLTFYRMKHRSSLCLGEYSALSERRIKG